MTHSQKLDELASAFWVVYDASWNRLYLVDGVGDGPLDPSNSVVKTFHGTAIDNFESLVNEADAWFTGAWKKDTDPECTRYEEPSE